MVSKCHMRGYKDMAPPSQGQTNNKAAVSGLIQKRIKSAINCIGQ